MKKFMKMAFAVVAFAAVGLGSYRAYGSYTAANMSEEDLLITENVLALSEGNSDGSNMVHVRTYVTGYCWVPSTSSGKCDNSKHDSSCKVTKYTYPSTPKTLWHGEYISRRDISEFNYGYEEWQEGDDKCSGTTTSSSDGKPADSESHTNPHRESNSQFSGGEVNGKIIHVVHRP